MIDLVQLLDAKVNERIKVSPCHANRASSLGYFIPELGGCLRRGYYERTAWQEKELPDVSLQRKFDEGNWHEVRLINELNDAGARVIESQRSFDWPAYQITGHIDGKIVVEDGRAIPLEIKSMAPAVYDQVKTFEDLKRYPWTRTYQAQLQLYMLMNNEDEAILLLKNKGTGEVRQINVKLDYELAEAALKAAEKINSAVKTGLAPDRIENIETCELCPFRSVCLPAISWNAPLTIAEDPGFVSSLVRYHELEPAEKEANKLWETIKKRVRASAEANGGQINELVGGWHIKGGIKNGRLTFSADKV